MAAPTVTARSSGEQASNSLTHAVTLPSTSLGELLVVVFSADGTNSDQYVDRVVSGDNWAQVGIALNGAVVTGSVYAKIAEATNALQINTIVAEQSTHVGLSISGGNTIAQANANGSSTDSDPPSLDVGSSPDTLWIATRSGDAQVVATVAPSGYSNLQTRAASGANGASTNTAEFATTADGIEDPGVFTSATEQWVAFTLGIYQTTPEIRMSQLLVEVATSNVADDPAPPATSSRRPVVLVIT